MADPAPSWDWVVYFPSIMGVSLPITYVEEIEFTLMDIPANGKPMAGTQIYFPGANSVGGVSVTFYEDVNYLTTNYLASWRALIVDPATGYYGLPRGGVGGGYKKEVSFQAFNGLGGVAFKGVFTGMWPTQPSGLSFQSQSSDRVRITCNFSVDDTDIQTGGADSFSLGALNTNSIGSSLGSLGSGLGSLMPDITNTVNSGFDSIASAANTLSGLAGTVTNVVQTVQQFASNPIAAATGLALSSLSGSVSGATTILGAAAQTVNTARTLISAVSPRSSNFQTGGLLQGVASGINTVTSATNSLAMLANGQAAVLRGMNNLINNNANNQITWNNAMTNTTNSATSMQYNLNTSANTVLSANNLLLDHMQSARTNIFGD